MTETIALRSSIMRAVKSKNTSPELFVRRLVFAMGFRYRLHRKDLPGTPDLVFSGLRRIIFVHGCFWHGHSCSRGARQPKSNSAYWREKIRRNVTRDRMNIYALVKAGWQVKTIWECELGEKIEVQEQIMKFLGPNRKAAGQSG